VYQLVTANGHIFENLVNVNHLRKLDEFERKRYTGDFWNVSDRLKLHVKRARDQQQLQNLDVELKKATLENLKAQRLGKPVPLQQIAEISAKKNQVKQQLQELPSDANSSTPSTSAVPELGKRVPRFLSGFTLHEHLFYSIIGLDY
jgi:hypothetical protein